MGTVSFAPQVDRYGIKRWSTLEVPSASRFDYYACAISEAVMPLRMTRGDPASFNASLSHAQIDAVGVSKIEGAAHGLVRGPNELARSGDHRFSLMMSLDAIWTAEHRGRLQLLPRDVLLCDSEYPLSADVSRSFSALAVSFSESWLRRWLPNPGTLVGKRIAGQTPWGHALSSFLAALSPELAAAPPLPLAVLADQVGSLLALTSGLRQQISADKSTSIPSLHGRAVAYIEQSCTDIELTAGAVANALGTSPRTLHRALASAGRTFGAILIEARAKIAERMLASPSFRRLTTAEIGRRAGFTSPSHFARVIRERTGRTPLQWRRSKD